MQTFLRIDGLVYTVNEPELSYTSSKTAIVKFSVCANRQWKDGGGAAHEESCFIECVCWGKLAESADKYVKKGDPLFITGNLNQDRWEKDGQKHSRHTMTVDRIVFLKPKEE